METICIETERLILRCWKYDDRKPFAEMNGNENGYATEAAKACIVYAREKNLFKKLYSFTAIPNIPSENVMKRIGMTCKGTFMHPALTDGHWLKEHKLYTLDL